MYKHVLNTWVLKLKYLLGFVNLFSIHSCNPNGTPAIGYKIIHYKIYVSKTKKKQKPYLLNLGFKSQFQANRFKIMQI